MTIVVALVKSLLVQEYVDTVVEVGRSRKCEVRGLGVATPLEEVELVEEVGGGESAPTLALRAKDKPTLKSGLAPLLLLEVLVLVLVVLVVLCDDELPVLVLVVVLLVLLREDELLLVVVDGLAVAVVVVVVGVDVEEPPGNRLDTLKEALTEALTEALMDTLTEALTEALTVGTVTETLAVAATEREPHALTDTVAPGRTPAETERASSNSASTFVPPQTKEEEFVQGVLH